MLSGQRKKRVLFCEAGHHGGSVNRLLVFLGKIEESWIAPVLLTYYRDGKAGRLFELPGSFPRLTMGVDSDPPPETIRTIGRIPVPTLFSFRYYMTSLMALRTHRPDVVYLNNTPFCQLPMIAACRRHRVPVICHMRDTVKLTRSERWALEGVDRVIALSEAAKRHYSGQGIPPGKIDVIYDGISLEDFDRKKKEPVRGIPEGRTVVALVGSLVPRKRQMDAVRAIHRLADEFPDLLLVLYGDGPDRGKIEDYVGKNGLEDHVLVNGWTENVAPYLAASRIGLMVSDREGMPNVVMEYMAASLPVVVTKLPGIDEMVADGINGIHVEINDIESLAGSIRRLLRDGELRERFGRKGRAILESGKFTIEEEHDAIRSAIRAVSEPAT